MELIELAAPPLPHYIACGEDTYMPGRLHPNRKQLGVFDLIYVTKGCLYMSEEDRQYEIDASSYLVLNPDRHHFPTKPCSEETRFYWLHFHTYGKWAEGLSRMPEDAQLGDLFHPARVPIVLAKTEKTLHPSAVSKLFEQLLTLEHQADQASGWNLQLVFQQLLKILSEPSSRYHGREAVWKVAEAAAAYLRSRYQEQIAYGSMAADLNYHPNHIARCMTEVYGLTPLDYVNRYRIEQSKILLIKTDESISSIAEAAGFRQLSYFGRLFKELEGMTPREYRRTFQ